MLKGSALPVVEDRVGDMESQWDKTYTTTHAEDGLDKGVSFKSYPYQALKHIYEEALLT